MTMIHDIEIECSVCGEKSSQPILASTNSMGYADLDLRPPEMQRSTMSTWLMECPHCGYVAGDLEDELKIDKEFIKTEKYMTCDGFEFERKLAARFYRRFLISNEMDYAEGSFFNLLHCAWVCDDAEDIENARKIRMLSLPYIDSLIALDDDRKKDYLLMKADVLRRSGQFDQLIDEYRDVIFGEEIYNKVITFQIQKANLGDDACYTVEDVVNL